MLWLRRRRRLALRGNSPLAVPFDQRDDQRNLEHWAWLTIGSRRARDVTLHVSHRSVGTEKVHCDGFRRVRVDKWRWSIHCLVVPPIDTGSAYVHLT